MKSGKLLMTAILIVGLLSATVAAAPPGPRMVVDKGPPIEDRPPLAAFAGTAEMATEGHVETVTRAGILQGMWTLQTPSPVAAMDQVTLWTPGDGGLWSVGGYTAGGATRRYDPPSGTWTLHATEPAPVIAYPVDGCYGLNAVGEEVIILFPDTTGTVSGVLHRYNVTLDVWDTPPVPAGFPANGIWAHDIVSMASITGENVCYLSGGATTPGGGDLSDLWAYYPATNMIFNRGSFTHIPDGFDFHASWFVPWIGAAGAICVGGGVDLNGVEYADTQCYYLAEQAFNYPDWDLGLLPEPWWAMADGWKVHEGEYQIWIVDGAGSGAMLQASAFMDATNYGFVYGPPPQVPRFRLEGDDWNLQLYAEQGSSNYGFIPSTANQYLNQGEPPPCEWQTLFFEGFEGGMGNWTMTGLWNEEHETDACGSLVAPFPSSDTAAYFGIEGTCTFNNPYPYVSWYWDGDNYGNPPHNPCSNDGYTPSGMSACDEANYSRAYIPYCGPSVAGRDRGGPPTDIDSGVAPEGNGRGIAREGNGITSLSGSVVNFDGGSQGYDSCWVPSTTQTFCFLAESYTNDWEYAYYVWMKFPFDWEVLNVWDNGPNICDNGGYFGSFGWGYWDGPWEVQVLNQRVHANPDDHCYTYLCFDVATGSYSPSGGLEMVVDVPVPANAVNAEVAFGSYEQTECGGDCYYDNRYVQFSTDGGFTWNPAGEGDTENMWYNPSINLPYASGPLRVRFQFDALDYVGNDYFGWMVDDVEIRACTAVVLAPSNLHYTAIAAAHVDLAWFDNSGDETSFHIERSPDGAAWAEIGSVGANVNFYTDGGLSPGTTYYYRVRAYRADIDQYSAYSNVLEVTTVGGFAVPPAITRP